MDTLRLRTVRRRSRYLPSGRDCSARNFRSQQRGDAPKFARCARGRLPAGWLLAALEGHRTTTAACRPAVPSGSRPSGPPRSGATSKRPRSPAASARCATCAKRRSRRCCRRAPAAAAHARCSTSSRRCSTTSTSFSASRRPPASQHGAALESTLRITNEAAEVAAGLVEQRMRGHKIREITNPQSA